MIIFSTCKGTNPCEDSLNIQRTVSALSRGPYAALAGVYRGTSEVSFMTSQKELAIELAKDTDQDCYLERGHYGYWYLIDTKTDKILDTFKTIKEVTKDAALRSEYYSMLNGKYYLASKY